MGDRTFLGSKDLGETADRTEKCPTETTEKKKWILKDNKVKNYVLRTVDKKVKPHIIHCVHGNDMFLKLQTLYKKGYARENTTVHVRLFQLQIHQIHRHSHKH